MYKGGNKGEHRNRKFFADVYGVKERENLVRRGHIISPYQIQDSEAITNRSLQAIAKITQFLKFCR